MAIRYGRGPSVLASILSVAAFDFFFVPPYLTFAVSDIQYLLTFAVMLVVALTISGLAVRTKQQADLARHQERRTAVLYALSRDLATHRGTGALAQLAAKHLRDVFNSQVAIFLADADKRVQLQRGEHLYFEFDPKESGVAQWVFEHNERAGLGTDTLPGASALYLPLVGSAGSIGVVAVRPTESTRLSDTDQLHLLESLVNQVALAIERACPRKPSRLMCALKRSACGMPFSVRSPTTCGLHWRPLLGPPVACWTSTDTSILQLDSSFLDPFIGKRIVWIAYSKTCST